MTGVLLLLAAVLVVSPSLVLGANPPPPVTLRKCCPEGTELQLKEHFDRDSILDAVECIPSKVTMWVPKIKYKKKEGFFAPEGGKPKFMFFDYNKLPLSSSCSEPMYTSGENSVILFTDGSLVVRDRNLYITQRDRFCVDRQSAIYCLPPETNPVNSIVDSNNSAQPLVKQPTGEMIPTKYHRKRTTVRKCCPQGFAYNALNRTCVFLSNPMNPLNTKPVFDPSALQKTRLDMLYGFPTSCGQPNFAILGTFKQDMFDEEQNVLRLENSDRELKEMDFCLEHMFARENDTMYSSFVTVFTCADFFPASGSQPEQNEIPRDYRYVVYSVGLIISMIFLIATLVISFLVPSNHHALHWRCQTYYVACLLVGDFFLAITQLAGDSILQPYCSIIATTMHFAFLAAFFWLNTMCFNIWWTFRDFRPTSLERGQELCRLRIYELYAWGFPLFIAALALLFDNLPNSEEYLRPRFGEKTCWFYGDKEIFTYFFAPIGALLIINILLFVSTTRQLTCGLWKRDDVKTTTEKSALGRVCMKLVVVMGITWILDVISWLVGGPHYFWYLTDFINAAQGFFIFCVVGLQPQIRVALKRFWSSNTGGNTTTNGPQHSSSSHGLPSMGESVTNNTFTNTTLNNNNSICSTTKVPLETVC